MTRRMFALNMKTLRTRRGLTQVQLAKRLKVSQAHVAQLENGELDNPTLATLMKLAKALKVTVAELVK